MLPLFDLLQRIQAGKSLLTKGPFAFFFGGEDIIPLVSSDSTMLSNFPIFLLIALSVLMQVMLLVYKRLKFRKEIRYEQQLNQAMMSGVRNVYGHIVIFLEFLGFTIMLVVHLYLVKNLDTTNKVPVVPPFLMASFMISFVLNIFIRNHKLRFLSNHFQKF